jgi:hypothetical protein
VQLREELPEQSYARAVLKARASGESWIALKRLSARDLITAH